MIKRLADRLLHKDFLCLLLGFSFGLNLMVLWFCLNHITGTHHRSLNSKWEAVKERRKFYLCPYFRGGLGNHMFQFASIYGIAGSRGMKVGLPPSNRIFNIFEISSSFLTNSEICQNAHPHFGGKNCAFDEANMAVPTDRDVIHLSYLQSWKYFSNVEKDIRKYFTFKKNIKENASSLIKQAILNSSFKFRSKFTIVGIHVRRGDYLDDDKIKYGYRVATRDYFQRTMNFFRSKYKNSVFLVFTNPVDPDMTWCKTNIRGNDVIYMFGNSRDVDLCVLSMCNHVITSVGTFGWWAGWLNNGTVTYYRDFVKPGSEYEKCFQDNGADYFYPEWLGF